MTTLVDDIFLLRESHDGTFAISVFDCNNMQEVKDVIPLTNQRPEAIAASSVSNCVYLLNKKLNGKYSVSAVTKSDDGPYSVNTLISDISMSSAIMSVDDTNGSLIISRHRIPAPSHVFVYKPNGVVQYKTKIPSAIKCLHKIMPTSNGNLVLASANETAATVLTEIDVNGKIMRQCKSAVNALKRVHKADLGGCIMLTNNDNKIELRDSQLNLIKVSGPQMAVNHCLLSREAEYNRDRNEVFGIGSDPKHVHGVLTFLKLIEN